jgi:hypothetical protein
MLVFEIFGSRPPVDEDWIKYLQQSREFKELGRSRQPLDLKLLPFGR